MAHTLSTKHAILGAALVLVLAPSARAQERMPAISKDKLTPEQLKLGNLAGPWIPLSRSPEVAKLMIDMRSHVASRTLLPLDLTEIPILIAAREWSQQFEWNAHEGIATKAGLKPEIIAAIKEGRRPRGMSEAEESLYDFCMELQRSKGVSDITYDRALKALGGEDKIVEAVALQGYYSLLAMVMNVNRTPLGAGAKPLPLLPAR